MRKEILRIEDVTVEINGVTYLNGFNMHILQGEIMGLVGIDGHGLDQLIQLIQDNSSILYGRVYYKENLVNTYIKESRLSNRIFVIGQQSSLVPGLTVSDNIFVLRNGFRKYIINRKVLREQVIYHLKGLGVNIDPDMSVSKLTLFERCVIELVKATTVGSSLIIVHEISEVLSSIELPRFQKIVQYYAAKGFAFMYIGNHYKDVFGISDRFCLLQEGKIIKVILQKDMDLKHVESFVEGVADRNTLASVYTGVSILEFEHIETENLHDFTCSFYAGECVTIYDKNNTTFRDIINLIAGEEKFTGCISIQGNTINPQKRKTKMRREIAIISENPIEKMIFRDMSYMENLSFLVDQKMKKSKISRKVLDSIVKEYLEELGEELYCNEINTLNSQSLYNLIYYRILLYHPQVVFIIQPFLGADMYLRGHIVSLINRLKKDGMTVIILAVHMADTLAVSDRFIILEEGHLVENLSEEEKELIRSR